jgi:hypothetical protein
VHHLQLGHVETALAINTRHSKLVFNSDEHTKLSCCRVLFTQVFTSLFNQLMRLQRHGKTRTTNCAIGMLQASPVGPRFGITTGWKSFLVWFAMTVVWLVGVRKQSRSSTSASYRMDRSFSSFSRAASSSLYSRACRTRKSSAVMIEFGGWLMLSVNLCKAKIRR